VKKTQTGAYLNESIFKFLKAVFSKDANMDLPDDHPIRQIEKKVDKALQGTIIDENGKKVSAKSYLKNIVKRDKKQGLNLRY